MSARPLLLVLLAALIACAGSPVLQSSPPLTRPSVERVGRTTVRIRWPESFTNETVAVYTGVDPAVIDHTRPLAISATGSVLLTTADDPEIERGRRLYYELWPLDGSAPVVVAERRLPLKCCDNFRDLGGYRTRDGRFVRWNRLYRANSLASLSRSDLDYLGQLDIKLVCDFRSDRERAADPDSGFDASEARMLTLPITQEGVDPAEMARKIRTGGLVALGVEKTMRAAYRAFVTDYSDEWSAMFDRLLTPENLPTVVHCTAGKDRTGFASALVLFALGVPEETVFEDYLLTNRYQENFRRFVMRWVPLYSLFRTDAEDLLPLLEARRVYLQTSIDAMVEGYGSVDAYLEQRLGLNEQRRAELASLFLE